jgi:hypothetical protein
MTRQLNRSRNLHQPKMTNAEFRRNQYEVSVIAGMNQRYHQICASRLSRQDRDSKIAVGLLATFGFCFSAITVFSGHWALLAASVVTSGLAAAVAVWLSVKPYGEMACRHTALFQRWTDLREEVESLLFDLAAEPDGPLIARLKEISAKVHRICAAEPGCDTALLNECQQAEERSRRGSAPVKVAHPSAA